MVATVSRLHGGNATYYTKSYYLNGQAEGEWLDTEAAASLKLAHQGVTPAAFERLLRGFHPRREEKLVQNAGVDKRQLGWDVQFAVDKSFSVLYAMVPEARGTQEACLKEAVRSTVLEVLEPEFLETRRGQGGKIREGVSSPVAVFLHRTNRENEIHLHCHAAIPNVGVRRDGTRGTIVSWNLYDAKLALGKAFHARYAELVAERLGIECEFDRHGLSRVRGFPEPVAEALSTPTRKIAEIAEDESARAKEEANLKLRPVKSDVPLEEVERECRRRADELGFSEGDARDFLGRASRAGPADEERDAEAVLRGVLEALPREFSKAQLFEGAFREGAKAGLSFAAVGRAVREVLSDEMRLEPLGRISGREQYRKAGEIEGEKSPLEREESHEEDLRQFLGQIIGAAEEFHVVEFLPPSPDRTAEPALPELDEAAENHELAAPAIEIRTDAGITPDDIRAIFEPIGLALHLQEKAVDSLVEAARARMERDAEIPAAPVETRSPDTVSPVLEADAAGRLERRWAEASGLPEDEARSVLGEVVGKARDAHAERLVDTAIAKGLEAITEREAHFTRGDLQQVVEQALAGKGIPFQMQDAALDRALADAARVVPLGKIGGREHFSTPEILRAEAEAIRAAGELQARDGHARRASEVRDRLDGMPLLGRNAVAKALSGSDFMLIEATDGRAMHEVQRGIGRVLGQKDVLWVAPTATAARELERSVGAEKVASLQKLLLNLDRGFADIWRHHGRMVVHAALGLSTWGPRQLSLTPQTTVVLDSASLVDTRRLSRLLTHASEAGARVIACSTHGMDSLGPGGLLRDLRGRSRDEHVVTLPGAGGRDSRVEPHIAPSREGHKKALIDEWSKAALKAPWDHTIVAASSRDVHELNRMAQARRKEAGELGFRSLEVRYKLGDEVVKERIYEGDRVVFTARTDAGVVNGVFGTVKHIDLILGRVTVALDLKEKKILPWEFDRQKTITFQYRNYKFFRRQEEGFRLGYAATIFRSQNVAVEGNSYCLVGGPGGAPSAIYAGLGLAKGTNHLFGDAKTLGGAELLRPKETAHAVEARAEHEARERERAKFEEQERARQAAMEQEMGRGF